jgi:general secretion pathway protein N
MKKSMRILAWVAVPLTVWLALVIRATPAHWGIWLAGLPVQMDGVTGTVWDGRVANVVIPYGGNYYSLGTLEWDLDPWSLLTLSPCAEFSTELGNQTTAGTACAGLGGTLTLKNTELSLPTGIAEIWAPVQVRGQVDAQIQRLTFSDNQIRELNGSGSWSHAFYHNSQTWVPLGTIAFDLSEDSQGGLAAKVFDIEGPVEVDLDSRFSLAGAYDIRGNIALRPGAPQEIGQLLMIVARETQRGQFSVEWVGS